MIKEDYIHWIRQKVGHDKIFLNFVVALLLNDSGQILLNRRGDSGKWGFIGGAMELGESFEETLRREVFEETGITKLEFQKQLGVYNWIDFSYPSGDVAQPIDIFYSCLVKQPVDLTYRDVETLELAWFDPSAITSQMLFNPKHLEVLADYQSQK